MKKKTGMRLEEGIMECGEERGSKTEYYTTSAGVGIKRLKEGKMRNLMTCLFPHPSQ